MIGSIIGGAIGLGSSIYGGVKASQAYKQANQKLKGQREENQNWYDRRYNEDSTQRADAQRLLTHAQEQYRNRSKQAESAQAVMGGTDESVAASKAANAQALAETTSRIAVTGDARKDNIEAQYRTQDANITDQMRHNDINRANAIAQASQGVASAAGTAGTSIDGWLAGIKDDKEGR